MYLILFLCYSIRDYRTKAVIFHSPLENHLEQTAFLGSPKFDLKVNRFICCFVWVITRRLHINTFMGMPLYSIFLGECPWRSPGLTNKDDNQGHNVYEYGTPSKIFSVLFLYRWPSSLKLNLHSSCALTVHLIASISIFNWTMIPKIETHGVACSIALAVSLLLSSIGRSGRPFVSSVYPMYTTIIDLSLTLSPSLPP